MNFEPTSEQQLVIETARAFARRELAPMAARRDRESIFPADEMRKLGELGLLGMTVPEPLGGTGAGAVALAHAVAEIAEVDASVAVTMSVTNMVAEVLAHHAPPSLRDRVVPALCSGAAVAGALALSEAGAGSDVSALRTAYRKVDGGYLLSGAKLWTTSGDHAGVLVVVARDSASAALSAFAVEGGTKGLTFGSPEHKMGQRGSSTVPVLLDDVFVSESCLLGREGEGLAVALSALDGGRINVAAMAVGIGRAALAAAVNHVQSRHQFGKALAHFQGVKFQLADSSTALEAAWLMVERAAWHKERRLPLTRVAAEAKLFATDRAVEVCDRAIQLHGGYGYSREYPVERYFRDVRVTTIYEGTNQIQRLVIARRVLAEREALHG